MSTSTTERPPREVFTARDAQEVADYLAEVRQHRRWARWLAAKQLVARTIGRTRDKALQLIERCRLEGAVRMVRRAAGWAATGLGLLRRGFEIVGMASAVGWVIASPAARNLLDRAGQAVVGVARRVGRTLASVGSWALGLFGEPGRRVATRIAATTAQVKARVTAVTAPVIAALKAALDVRSLQVRTIGAWATERAVGRVLGRVLPQPYAAVVRVLTGLLMLPRAVQDELVRLVRQGVHRFMPCPAPATVPTNGSSRATRTSKTAPSRPTATASSTTTSSTTESAIPGVDWQALAQDVDASEGPAPSTSRYPASNTGRKGSSRRR